MGSESATRLGIEEISEVVAEEGPYSGDSALGRK
jgi:hypothetical protein